MRYLILPALLCAALSASAGEPMRDASYDRCLATGHTASACDAFTRVVARERERIRAELERQWCTDPNPFARIVCLDEVQARLDSMSFDVQ